VILGRQALNRTLLHRQHLLDRSTIAPTAMVEHLVGLQAQENLPPYLSLNARLEQLDPHAVSEALGDKELVRLLVMRGTIHLLTPDDALTLRQFTQVSQDRERRASQNTRPALHLDLDAVHAAVDDVLEPGPLPVKVLGEALATEFDAPANALGHLARVGRPLAQLPPRGQWKQSGGVVYQRVDRWLGRDLIEPDVEQIVRRYLAAFGPATPADFTAWSGVPGMAAVLKDLGLEVHHDDRGKVLYDVPGGEIVEDGPAPVRMFGTYDNVWLSHANRDRVTDPVKRQGWMGTNGGVAGTILVDGWLEGLWRIEDGKATVIQLLRDLTTREARELSDEIERTQQLLDS
jgi:hypothetical protein